MLPNISPVGLWWATVFFTRFPGEELVKLINKAAVDGDLTGLLTQRPATTTKNQELTATTSEVEVGEPRSLGNHNPFRGAMLLADLTDLI